MALQHALFFQSVDGDGYHLLHVVQSDDAVVQGFLLGLYDGVLSSNDVTFLPLTIPFGTHLYSLSGSEYILSENISLLAAWSMPSIDVNLDFPGFPLELSDISLICFETLYQSVPIPSYSNLPSSLVPVFAGGSSGGGGASGTWNFPARGDDWGGGLPDSGCSGMYVIARQTYVVRMEGTFFRFYVDPQLLGCFPNDGGDPNHFLHYLDDAVVIPYSDTWSRTALYYEFPVSQQRANFGGCVVSGPVLSLYLEPFSGGVGCWYGFVVRPCGWDLPTFPYVYYFPFTMDEPKGPGLPWLTRPLSPGPGVHPLMLSRFLGDGITPGEFDVFEVSGEPLIVSGEGFEVK